MTISPYERPAARMTAPDRERLTDRMSAINDELERLEKFDKLTNSQEHQILDLRDEWAGLEEQERQIARADQLDRIRAAQGAGGGVSSYRAENGFGGGGSGDTRVSAPVFGEAHRIIDSAARSKALPDYAAEKATNLVDNGPTVGRTIAARWATETGNPAYASAFAKLLADPERGHLLWDGPEQEAFRRVVELQSEMRAMSLTDASGGFMVPLTLDPAILLTSAGSINPLRQISRVVTIATDVWNGVTSAGVTAEWISENTQVADASPTLAQPSIPIHKGDAFVPFSFEVGGDAMNFLQELQKLLVDAADQLQATAYTTGTGVGQPTGIIASLSGGSSIVTPTTAEVFAAADIYKVQAALPPRFSADAQWAAHIAIINSAAQMETTAGARLFPEIGTNQLLRKPLNELSNMDGVINPAVTEANHVVLYGDFLAGFVIVDRIGSTLEVVPHLFGANGRPTLQRGALLWFRTGSDVVVPNAFRLLNVATTA